MFLKSTFHWKAHATGRAFLTCQLKLQGIYELYLKLLPTFKPLAICKFKGLKLVLENESILESITFR